ncbi:MAG: polysaccharide biosynthesis C-terminal domain-containing protein [Puniceicoccales bacterium]|jgi:MATE family multidrug resistance protein|nr:polysaccharide biosynthesis C-terminal domain-containing protein [Puniceicoccales bacterium]
MNRQLTRYAPGSIRELWTIAWPLIIAFAANLLMVLCDRIILARFSTEAFQSQAAAMQWWSMVYYTCLNVAAISRVTVARFNGAGAPEKMMCAVWQMIWFCLALSPLLIVLAIWVAPRLIAPDLREFGVPYLRILLIAIPIPTATFGAITSYFAGQGKNRYTLAVAIASNVFNFALCILLVYGVGPFPRLGIMGAAIGTVIAQIFGLILAICFLVVFHKRSRVLETRWLWDFKLFREMLNLGFPNALACGFNWTLWSLMYQVAAVHVTRDQFTAFLVGHTIFVGLSFLVDGVSQSVGVISANAYGAKDWPLLHQSRRSWMCFLAIESVPVFVILILHPQPLIFALMPAGTSPEMFPLIRQMLFFMWLLLAAICYASSCRATLTALGDSRFILYFNTVLYPTLSIIPSCLALRYAHNIILAAASWVLYNMVSGIIYHMRALVVIDRREAQFSEKKCTCSAP